MYHCSMSISAILLAGGKGVRMNAPLPKQYLPLKGIPLALYSFEVLKNHPAIFEVIVVCEEAYQSYFFPHTLFASPGTRRQDSVFQGLQKTSPRATLICIHDSARPLLSPEDLDAVLQEAHTYGAASLARPISYSLKTATPDHFIAETIDRQTVWEMQTPQVARPDLLHQGFQIAHAQSLTVTDDNALIELTNHPIKLVPARSPNLKVTTPEDLLLAEALVESYVPLL